MYIRDVARLKLLGWQFDPPKIFGGARGTNYYEKLVILLAEVDSKNTSILGE